MGIQNPVLRQGLGGGECSQDGGLGPLSNRGFSGLCCCSGSCSTQRGTGLTGLCGGSGRSWICLIGALGLYKGFGILGVGGLKVLVEFIQVGFRVLERAARLIYIGDV